MNQRVMIAMAISCNPRLLIADEPTTALDVTIQAQILDLLRNLQKERGMALVLITHNMGVVGEMARRVAVMYAGQVMEQQPVAQLFAARSIPTPKPCCRPLPERARPAHAWRPFPAWCPACSTGRPAACSPRAAPTPPRIHGGAARTAPLAGRPGALPLPAGRSAAPKATMHAMTPPVPIEVTGDMTVVVEAKNLRQVYKIRRGFCARPRICRRWAACPSRSRPARRWPWSANPAAASPRSPAWCR